MAFAPHFLLKACPCITRSLGQRLNNATMHFGKFIVSPAVRQFQHGDEIRYGRHRWVELDRIREAGVGGVSDLGSAHGRILAALFSAPACRWTYSSRRVN